MIITSFRELIVYQKAYKLSMEIFNLTKTFPKEEKYSLTEVWLQYSLDCQYLTIEQYNQIIPEYEEVRKLLIYMMNNSSKFCKK